MASNLRVDTILPSSGTTLGIGTASGTINFLGNSNIDTSGTLTAASASITGNLGVGGVLTYEDVTNIDSVGVITGRSNINCTSGRFQRGSATVQDGDAIAGGININGTDMDASVIMSVFGNDGDFTRISGSKSRNASVGSHTIVQNNDVLLSLKGFGSDGTNFEEAAQIEMQVDGSPGNDDMPGRIVFKTTADGASSPTERLRIGSAGQIGIAGANYGTSGQVLTSAGSGSAVQWATPAGGITHARVYRLTTTVNASGGSQILTPWDYEDDAASGHLGSGWSLPSSGVFSFPTTGIYDVSIMGMMNQQNDSNAWCGVQGLATVNNSSYSEVFEVYQQIVQASGSSTQYVNFYGHCMLDVTDTSNVKFRISFFSDGNEAVILNGNSNNNLTALKIIRLGDT